MSAGDATAAPPDAGENGAGPGTSDSKAAKVTGQAITGQDATAPGSAAPVGNAMPAALQTLRTTNSAPATSQGSASAASAAFANARTNTGTGEAVPPDAPGPAASTSAVMKEATPASETNTPGSDAVPPASGISSAGAGGGTKDGSANGAPGSAAPARPPLATAGGSSSNGSVTNNTAGKARSPALAAAGGAGSGTASPGGYKPFDYSQPLSTYSPATSAYGSSALNRRSPIGHGGFGVSGAAASPAGSSGLNSPAPGASNPIAAGFTYGATGQRGAANATSSVSSSTVTGGSAPPQSANRASPAAVQSRTGNNATPLTAPSIVSRTSGGVSPQNAGATANNSTEAPSSVASASQPSLATAPGGPGQQAPSNRPSSAGQQSRPGSTTHGNGGQAAGGPGQTSLGSGGLSHHTRDPRTPNPVTESLLSRSPISAAATNASIAKRVSPNPTAPEQSRTGGINTPLAPNSATAGQVGGAGSNATASPAAAAASDAAKRNSPAQSPANPAAHQPTSWRSLLDRPYAGLYGSQQHGASSASAAGQGANASGRPQQPAGQRPTPWFNPLAQKQQQNGQNSASGYRPLSASANPAPTGSPHNPTQPASSAAAAAAGTPANDGTAAAGASGPGAPDQNQAAKRRTSSTSAATPPYPMSSLLGNRPGSASDVKKEGQPSRAVTASPIVGSAAAPVPNSAPPTGSAVSTHGTSGKVPSPAYQHRPSYSMTYGERLQQAQQQAARDRDAQREAREREMRERERTAAAIVGPLSGKGSPPLSATRPPYYGLGGSTSAAAAAAAAHKLSNSPPLPSAGAGQGPLSPPRRPADRPPSTSAFGYLFGGGGASRVATESAGTTRQSPSAVGTHQNHASHLPGGSASPASSGPPPQAGHYRLPSGSASQPSALGNASRPGAPVNTAPLSRTQNTGLGLSSIAANAAWRSPLVSAAQPATASVSSLTDKKPEVSTANGAKAAGTTYGGEPSSAVPPSASLPTGHKRKRSDAQDHPPSSAARLAQQSATQPPPNTLHALRQREGPLFTAEDIKGAALRPPLMVVRSDNVVKALHKISAQHAAQAGSSAGPAAPFLGRIVYDPFKDPADLLDGALLRQGVGGKVEIWLDTEWLQGEVWEAGAPSHPAVSHPPSPVSDDASLDDATDTPAHDADEMQVDAPGQGDSDTRPDNLGKGQMPPSWTLWDLPPIRARKIWGTDVYTDDSDILAACIHSGWLRLGSTAPLFGATVNGDAAAAKSQKRRKKKPTLKHRSLRITIVVAPKLIKYEGSLRAGVGSRSWGNSHDGVSYAIESVELVNNVSHRLGLSRWKAHESSYYPLARQRCACASACDHTEKPTIYPRSFKLGQMLVKAS